MPTLFHCKICDFSSSKESNYLNHISTRKHKNQQNVNNFKHINSLLDNDNVCVCGKAYKERTGLWRHRKKCPMVLKNEEDCTNNNFTDIDNAFTKDELLLKLIKNNDEMMKIIKGQQEQINNIIPKICSITNNTNNTTNNTTHNNFNLSVFLNEH